MTDVAAPLPLALPRRAPAYAAAATLALSAGLLAARLSPSALPAMALALAIGIAALGLAALADETSLWAKVFAAAAAACALVAAAPEAMRLSVALLSLALLAGGTWKALSRAHVKLTLPLLALAAALVAALGAFNAYYVIASQDLQIADFMFYRVVSVAVGTLTREGKLLPLALDLAGSVPKDYSWAPALLPGFALAAFGLLSRAVYQGAIVVFYAAPALLALAWAAREIAGRRDGVATAAFALAAVAAAYPFGLVVAARGMPDIGGLALFVIALRLADKLAQALALPPGHGARVQALVRRLSFGLALTLFAMFLFRRWYAFAATALMLAFAAEVAVTALRRGAAFNWRGAALAACVGALTLFALLAPVLLDWLPNPGAHDYARMYAAYRKTPAVLVEAIGDWAGFAPLALALCGAIAWGWRSRLARLAFLSGPIAAALFLRVQSPYPHHLYLIAPFVALFIAAPLLLLFAKSRPAGLAALAALAAMTMTPLGGLPPRGLFPAAALPHAPRSDLTELARLKDWVDARATPEHKVCGLGSSYTFSGQLIGELWQIKPGQSPLARGRETSVGMSDVDTVDGAPTAKIKDCALLIVGDPVQTHVIPSYQLTVTLPSREMLEGVGIGAHYRRSGEVFALERGVKAVVFERASPLSDADMAALAERWRAARAKIEGAGRR